MEDELREVVCFLDGFLISSLRDQEIPTNFLEALNR